MSETKKFTICGNVTYKWWLTVEAESIGEASRLAEDRVGDGLALTLGQYSDPDIRIVDADEERR